jgi:hypothetical protein
MWREVRWSEVMWSEVRWSEVRRCEAKWGEVRWRDVKWSEEMWSEVNWSEAKRSEVIILGEMCVLSWICSYVAVCRVCVVPYLIINGVSFLFSNYSTYVIFNILFVCFLFSILWIPCFCIVVLCVWFVLFPLSCSLSPIFVPIYQPLSLGENPIAVNKYHHHHYHHVVYMVKSSNVSPWIIPRFLNFWHPRKLKRFSAILLGLCSSRAWCTWWPQSETGNTGDHPWFNFLFFQLSELMCVTVDGKYFRTPGSFVRNEELQQNGDNSSRKKVLVFILASLPTNVQGVS